MADNPFDLNKYAEELRKMLQEKIRCDIATLMPEGVWLEHVKREVEEFVKADRNGESPLRKLIGELLRVKAGEEIKKCIATEGVYFGNVDTPAIIKEVIKDNAPELMAAVFGKALQDHVREIMNNLPASGMGGFR
jgi:hypothetical protein